jgi:hypothetical protein
MSTKVNNRKAKRGQSQRRKTSQRKTSGLEEQFLTNGDVLFDNGMVQHRTGEMLQQSVWDGDKVATAGGEYAQADSGIARMFVRRRIMGKDIDMPLEQFLEEFPDVRNATGTKIDSPEPQGHVTWFEIQPTVKESPSSKPRTYYDFEEAAKLAKAGKIVRREKSKMFYSNDLLLIHSRACSHEEHVRLNNEAVDATDWYVDEDIDMMLSAETMRDRPGEVH